ncbi:MAG: dienelactone hydrolase family protein [Chloroflexi bacterium]|nr:dienelactone hydrolase family protein [Chloroflexota bacterium]
MCFQTDSRPPILPMAGAAVDSRDLELAAVDGNRFSAMAALASERPEAGILILPDIRGLHPYYEELALRFAEAGLDAVAIDYFGRTAGVGKRAAGFDHADHVAQITWAGTRSDGRAAAAWLRDERGARALFVVGFCLGGRLAFLSAADPILATSGVIGFYGVPVGPPRNDIPAPIDLVGEISSPVLGLFGGADASIPAEAVARFEVALSEAGIDHELVTYPDAPHSFFDRKQEDYAEESAAAWRRVLGFIRSRATAD